MRIGRPATPRSAIFPWVEGLPGTAVPGDGYLVPGDAPGFGLEVTLDWLERAALV